MQVLETAVNKNQLMSTGYDGRCLLSGGIKHTDLRLSEEAVVNITSVSVSNIKTAECYI